MGSQIRRRSRAAVLCSALALLAVPSAADASLSNGGFEVGNLSGWTAYDDTTGAGSWVVYFGTPTLVNSPIVPPSPPEGKYAAVTDQSGPGLHVIHQDIAVPALPKTTQTLQMIVFYESGAPLFSPDTLDHTGPQNQQYRIDIVRPAADIESVAPGDVLGTVFRTLPIDPLILAPTPVTFDLTPFAGQTVRLRLAEVDNQFYFAAGADAVQVVPAAKCAGKAVTIFGTTGNDVLKGTAGKDVVQAYAGNDKINTKDGKDIVCGGGGNDTINAGGGNDLVLGQAGNDRIVGGSGKDRCKDGPSKDRKAACES